MVISMVAAIFFKVPIRGLELDFSSLAKAGWVIPARLDNSCWVMPKYPAKHESWWYR